MRHGIPCAAPITIALTALLPAGATTPAMTMKMSRFLKLVRLAALMCKTERKASVTATSKILATPKIAEDAALLPTATLASAMAQMPPTMIEP